MKAVSRNVLIVKLAAVGDVVMALPMVTALRVQDPDVRITWMCGHKVAPLVRLVEGVAEVVAVDEAAMLAGRTIAQIRAVLRAWRHVQIRHFDAVYIAHSDARYRVLAWPIRAESIRWLGGNAGNRGIVPGRAHTDEYVRLVTGLDDFRSQTFTPPALRIVLSPNLRRRIDAYNPERRPLIAITPGGARNIARENPLRRWPLGRYAELADKLHAMGYGVVLTGDRTDGWVRTHFRDSSRRVLDLIGATDLPSLAALLRACAVVVGHDSGPLHIARLVGTPVVALLGPTPPSMFFRPDPRSAVLWPGGALPCAPCYNGHEFAVCGNNVCMQMIECKSVINRLTEVVARAQVDTPTGALEFGTERLDFNVVAGASD
ncbi:MAG TPA: glycosyltransferase family 9 protein [Casimicrobiaceae bacterium]|nr:glycosyltransferase family 9 protein [Casimicrobiaceae bacterium]